MGRDYHSVPQPIFSLELEAAGKRIRLLMRFGGVHRININKALKETLNKWLRGRIAALRGVGFGRPLSRP
jgi:hypothetical protein